MRKAIFGLAIAALIAVVSASDHGQGAVDYNTGDDQGPSVPQADVWVIAETKYLPTNFNKIVLNDDLDVAHPVAELRRQVVERPRDQSREAGLTKS